MKVDMVKKHVYFFLCYDLFEEVILWVDQKEETIESGQTKSVLNMFLCVKKITFQLVL